MQDFIYVQRSMRRLKEDPRLREFFEGDQARPSGGNLLDLVRLSIPEIDEHLHPNVHQRTAVTSSTMGLASIGIAKDVLLATSQAGVYKYFRETELGGLNARMPKISGAPAAKWSTQAQQGTQLNAGVITGAGIDAALREVAGMVMASNSWLEDAPKQAQDTILTPVLAESLAGAVDHVAIAGTGVEDPDNAGQMGAATDPNVAVVIAGAAQTSVEVLTEDSVLRTLDAISDVALQKGARWWIHPSLFKKLQRVRNGSGAPMVTYLGAEAFMVGLPITLTVAAPGENAAGAKVLLCGCGQGYSVAVAPELSLQVSDSNQFDFNCRMIRAVMKVHCQMLEPTFFAVLQLAAA